MFALGRDCADYLSRRGHIWQAAARTNSQSAYERFVSSSMTTIRECTLRGQLQVVESEAPVDISEVEPASEIVKRFCTGEWMFRDWQRVR